MNHRRVLTGVLLVGTSLLFSRPSPADPVFDAHGFKPERAFFSELPYEHIDPLTGNLLLTFTDLVLPGYAGFDLRVQRTYNSKIYRNYDQNPTPSSSPLEGDTWGGLGWTLHFGRVKDNPLTPGRPGPIEMPDGSERDLFSRSDGTYTTRDHWIYNPNNRTLALPNGWIYTFGKDNVTFDAATGQNFDYATQIKDSYGNRIDIAYMTTGSGAPIDGIASVTQTLGSKSRTITFSLNTSAPTLKAVGQMSYGSRHWTYVSVSKPGSSSYSLLTSVTPPVGPAWRYGYNGDELTSLRTPHGGTISYTYQNHDFYLGSSQGITSPQDSDDRRAPASDCRHMDLHLRRARF